jgi:hypothetical protein
VEKWGGWMSRVFSFQKQLQLGERAEQLFQQVYPKELEIFPERKADFLVKETGELLELKADSYDMEKTPNFFIERFSDNQRKTPGGVWRAYQDDIDIFVYLFSKNRTYFVFDNIPLLVFTINMLTNNKPLVMINNKSWVTVGYKVERELLKDLYTEVKF